MKVLFLNNIPSPYRVDFFNELGKKCELTVLFQRQNATNRNSKWTSNNAFNFEAIYLNSREIGDDSAISFDILKYLDKKRYDVIVVGYSTPTGILAINYMKYKKIPFIINSDGGFIKENENLFKKNLKKYLISSASHWLSTGSETTKTLEYYGANHVNIHEYPFTSIYDEEILKSVPNNEVKREYKKNLNIKEDKMILTVSSFIHRKGIDVLLKAAKSFPSNIGLYIVGDEVKPEYQELADKLKLKNVHFLGFKSKQELNDFYLASDIFVLPTREDIWGLVINEAMAKALPIVTTEKCIAGLELVKDSESGYIVPVEDVNELAIKILDILNNDEKRKLMEEKSLQKIKLHTLENMANRHFDIFNNIK